MRHVRMLGLCCAAVFAIVAIAATSAAALPEFGQCYKSESHEGKYTDIACTKKAKQVNAKFTGEFEWRKVTEISKDRRGFLGIAGASVLDGIFTTCESDEVREEKCHEGEEEFFFLGEPGKPLKVECESERNVGEISGPKTVSNVSVVFHGCKLAGSIPCSNTVNEGEIQVNTLKGTIGFINKSTAPRQVGLLLEPLQKKGEFTKFTCFGGGVGTVVGEGNEHEGCAYPLPACGGDGIIGAIGPVNTTGSEFTQTFTVNEQTAENIPSKLEGKPLRELEAYISPPETPRKTTKWSKAGEEITDVTKLCFLRPGSAGSSECPEKNRLEVGEIKAN